MIVLILISIVLDIMAYQCPQVVRRLATFSHQEFKRVIVCHIGSGVSVTAVNEGKSLDTTMGYSPGSGLIMRVVEPEMFQLMRFWLL